MMKHFSKIAGALALALLMAACSNPLNERAPSGADGAEGKLAITIGGGERTLVPAADQLTGLSYTLLIRQNNTVIHSGAVAAGTPFEKALPPGYYEISIHAANSTTGAPVAEYNNNSVQVKAGETSRVNAVLKPVLDSDVPGTFEYKTVLPTVEEYPDGYTQALLTLNPDSSNSSINSGLVSIDLQDTTKRERKVILPPGVYQLKIELISTRQISGSPLKAARLETVYIYPRLTTKADYTFTAADFKGDVSLKGSTAVYRNNVNTPEPDYKPVEVEAELVSGIAAADAAVGKAAIAADGTWELFIPSHYLPGATASSGNVQNVRLRFKMGKASGNDVLYSPWDSKPIGLQGNESISLTATTMVGRIGSTAINVNTGTVQFNNADNVVVRDTDAIVTITPADRYGFIGNSLVINSSSVPVSDIVSENGKITARYSVTNSPPQVTNAQFFRLDGTVNPDNALPSGYSFKSIKARKIDAATGDYVDIASDSTFTSNQWTIGVPAGYVFKDSADNQVYFELTLAKSGGADVTFDGNGNFWSSVANLTTSTSVYNLNLNVNELFQARNVTAVVIGSNSVRVSWDAPAIPGATYHVMGYNSSTGNWGQLTNSAITAPPLVYEHTGITGSLSSLNYYVASTIGGTAHGSPSANATLQRPANLTAIAGTTTTGLLQSVALSWDAVPQANYYYVEYSTDGSSWYSDYVYGTTSYNLTSNIQPAGTYQFRVTAQSYYPIPASQPSAIETVSGPETENAWFYSTIFGEIQTPGERKYYRLPGNYSSVYVELRDSQTGNGTLDARLYMYRANNVNSYTYIDNYGTSFSAGYNDIIVVVEAADGSSTGSFSFYAQQN
jgi:hypothetical protein